MNKLITLVVVTLALCSCSVQEDTTEQHLPKMSGRYYQHLWGKLEYHKHLTETMPLYPSGEIIPANETVIVTQNGTNSRKLFTAPFQEKT